MTGTLISIRKGDILLVQQENSRRLPRWSYQFARL
jgi:hypothetical protein